MATERDSDGERQDEESDRRTGYQAVWRHGNTASSLLQAEILSEHGGGDVVVEAAVRDKRVAGQRAGSLALER
jgi:hypothetical protein